MAFIKDVQETLSDWAATSISVLLPAHESGDLLLVGLTQDNGGTNFWFPSWWTLVWTQSANQGQRTAAIYKIATGVETDPTVTGHNAARAITSYTIQWFDATTPIDAFNITDSADSASNSLTPWTLTTTTNNALVINFTWWDGAGKLVYQQPSKQITYSKIFNSGIQQLSWYYNQTTIWGNNVSRILCERWDEWGTTISVAIRDTDPTDPHMWIDVANSYDIYARYWWVSPNWFTSHDAITWDANITIIPTTISWLTIDWSALAIANWTHAASPRWNFTAVQCTGAGLTPWFWVWWTHTFDALQDFSWMFGYEWLINNAFTSRLWPEWIILYLEDDNAKWRTYQIQTQKNTWTNIVYLSVVDADTTPIYAENGGIDMSRIKRVWHMYHRFGNNAQTVSINVKNLIKINKCQIVWWNNLSVWWPVSLDIVMNGTNNIPLSSKQWIWQVLRRFGVQYGNWIDATYIDHIGTSLELPAILNLQYLVWPDASNCDFSLLASDNDTMRIRWGILSTEKQQTFKILGASSPDALYDFAGSIFVWYKAINNVVWVYFNECQFINCEIILNAGGIVGAIVRDSVALYTDYPDINDTRFVSPWTWHAIIIGDEWWPYDFHNNVFQWYGADNTDDACIFNNSGWEVILNLLDADQIPTIKNSVGSTTIINQTPLWLSATVLADSRVYLSNETQSTFIDNEFITGTSYFYPIDDEADIGDVLRIVITKKWYLPYEAFAVYEWWSVGFVVNQLLDQVYANIGIDWATITKFTANVSLMQIDLNVAENWSGWELYARYNNILTTDYGIIAFYQWLVAIDDWNFIINNDIVNIFFDNLTTTNVFQMDNRRIFRADWEYPIINPTTWWWWIDINRKSPVLVGDLWNVKEGLEIINENVKTSSKFRTAKLNLPA